MSIQDDIFDIEAALEGKPEAVAFERVCDYFFKVEKSQGELSVLFKNVRSSMTTLNEIFKDFK